MGKPLYGYVAEGYWQDIGNLDQYRQANFDALDERVKLDVPGIRLRGNVWVGEGVDLADLESVEGPAFIGNYCRVGPRASIGPYSVLMQSVTLGDHARTAHSVDRLVDVPRPQRRRRGRRSWASPATSARTRAFTRGSRSATTARSARRASSCRACASIRSRKSSPARSSTATSSGSRASARASSAPTVSPVASTSTSPRRPRSGWE